MKLSVIRTMLNRRACLFAVCGAVSAPVHAADLTLTFPAPVKVTSTQDGAWQSYAPVAYTHLDVYKRQGYAPQGSGDALRATGAEIFHDMKALPEILGL